MLLQDLDHIVFDTETLTLSLLDQRLLPEEEKRFLCTSVDTCITALKEMVVRGAPAIGVTAAWGAVLAVNEVQGLKNWEERLQDKLSLLAAARPTAVNLTWAVRRMRELLDRTNPKTPAEALYSCIEEAQRIQREDVAICRQLGANGSSLIPDDSCILTHCNAGALATAGYGTALGVIRAAFEAGKNIRVIADETRPFFQGARLTAWELARDNIPVTVACDNACALLMQRGRIDACVVGADRICANGDTANKIGTFGVAILAAHFRIPFYVAAPLSTIDRSLDDGSLIPIEERTPDEVTHYGTRAIVPDHVPVFNMAFDVTPNDLISAIITEKGVLRPPYTVSIKKAFS
ncbi:MAG: S-methyl-5-thioribose-1-phosphate isomerase [Desulfovibrio sp.]|nr:S-methyl-5-thioribose-1-phosphate isomerase [Desulfovibrio sp.]